MQITLGTVNEIDVALSCKQDTASSFYNKINILRKMGRGERVQAGRGREGGRDKRGQLREVGMDF